MKASTSSISFDKRALAGAKQVAKKENRSLSGYVRNLIEKDIKEAGK